MVVVGVNTRSIYGGVKFEYFEAIQATYRPEYQLEPVDFMEDRLYASEDTGDELFLKVPLKSHSSVPSESDYENLNGANPEDMM